MVVKKFLTSYLILILLVALPLYRVFYFHEAPEVQLASLIADDAFYYIQGANNKIAYGVWSLDGQTPTNGFHPLYAYLLLLIYWLDPQLSLNQLFTLIGSLAALSIGSATYLTYLSIKRFTSAAAALASICIFISPIFIIQSTILMESWLTLLFASSTLYLLVSPHITTDRHAALLLTIGLLGSLSRTDYGLFPAALFFTSTALYWKKQNPDNVAKSFCILCGAIIGVLLALINNWYLSGHWLQSSAKIKFFWSTLAHHPIQPVLNLLRDVVFPFHYFISNDVIRALTGILSIFILYRTHQIIESKTWGTSNNNFIVVMSACILSIIGYLYFYSHNSQALNVWYSTNFLIPSAVIIAGVSQFIMQKYIKLFAISVILVYGYIASLWVLQPAFPHQTGSAYAGQYLRSQNNSSRYAAWNAGVLSYFSKKPIVNLDGLVNDEIADYIKSNRLLDYLKEKDIDFIIDHEVMFWHDYLKIRGGYNDNRLACILPKQYFDTQQPTFLNSHLRLFQVNKNCI